MELKKEVNLTTKGIIRISIDGNWTSDMLIKLIEAFEFLNYIAELESFVRKSLFIVDDIRSSNSLSIYTVEEYKEYNLNIQDPISFKQFLKQPIPIKSIKYSSPGWIELVISSGLLALILGIIKYYVPNKSDEIKNKLQYEDYIKKRIENLKEIGLKNHEIQEVMIDSEYILGYKTKIIKKLINQAKITNIEGFVDK